MHRFRALSRVAGILAMVLIAPLQVARGEVLIADDPTDAVGFPGSIKHDIVELRVTTGLDSITNEPFLKILVRFAGDIAPASDFDNPESVTGYIVIDTNFDADIGAALTQLQDTASGPAPGIDYYIDLSSETALRVELLGLDLLPVGNPLPVTLPIEFDSASLLVTVPFSVLGVTTDELHFGALVGTPGEPFIFPAQFTDQAPDGSVPEPASCAAWSLVAMGLMVFLGRRKTPATAEAVALAA